MITEAIRLLGQDTHNIEEIQRRVQRWRLDCSETVLDRLKTALLEDEKTQQVNEAMLERSLRSRLGEIHIT